MRFIILYILIVGPFFCLSSQELNDQQWNAVSSGGDHMSSSVTGHSIDWVLGEIMTETFRDNDQMAIITQGFLQSKLVISQTNEPVSNNIDLSIYPNPSSNAVNIKTSNPNQLEVSVISANGSLISAPNAFVNSISIDLKAFPAGTYYLRFTDSETNHSSTFKIQKITE